MIPFQFSMPPVIDVLTPETFAHCRCNFWVRRTAHDHSSIVLRSPSNATVWTCFHWWFDDGGWFLQFSMPPVIDVLTPETFAYCQCNFVMKRTTCNHSHNRCIVLHSPSSVICLFFHTFAFTPGCLGTIFESCLLVAFPPLCLFHSSSFILLSVSLFFLTNCLQCISESKKSREQWMRPPLWLKQPHLHQVLHSGDCNL